MRPSTLVIVLAILAAPASGRALPFTLLGNLQWQDTGFDVSAGELLVIRATGLITFKPGFSPAGPDGWPDGPNPIMDAASLLPSANVLSLVGIVDPTGGALDDAVALPEGQLGFGSGFVGSSYAQSAPVSGRLYLAFNDSFFPDNVGSFEVVITPEPSTAVLTLTGVVGLSAWRRRARARAVFGKR